MVFGDHPLASSGPPQASPGFLLSPSWIFNKTTNLLGSVGQTPTSNLPLSDHINFTPQKYRSLLCACQPTHRRNQNPPQQHMGLLAKPWFKGQYVFVMESNETVLKYQQPRVRCETADKLRSTCGSELHKQQFLFTGHALLGRGKKKDRGQGGGHGQASGEADNRLGVCVFGEDLFQG